MGYGKIKVKMDRKEKQEKIVNVSKYLGNFKPKREDITNKQYAKTLVNMFEDLMYEVGEKDGEDINHYADSKEWKVDDKLILEESHIKVLNYLYDKRATKKGEFAKSSKSNIITPLIEYLMVLDDEEREGCGCEKCKKIRVEGSIITSNHHKKINESIKFYKAKKEILFDGIKQDYQKNSFTPNQMENYVSFEELHNDFFNKVKKRIKTIGEMSWEKKELLNVRLLLKLLIEHPTRNEYASLHFIKYQKFKKIKEPTKNYIIIKSKKNPVLFIPNYKTDKNYGLKTFEITNKELKFYIKEMYNSIPEGSPEEYPVFILTKTNNMWNNHNVSLILNKWSSLFLKKNISSTLITKIIINDLGIRYKKLLDEGKENEKETQEIKNKLKIYAKTRGHSSDTQLNIYIKKAD
jgi:hypothetical protein